MSNEPNEPPPPPSDPPAPSTPPQPVAALTVPVAFEDEMQRSYLEYAMSVIIGRAIPDARDGLKPVHRRILFAMHEMKLAPTSSYRKCAKVVGEVLGKFHPHGDSSVYDALVRMAQDFSMRMPLVDGQGNFGSVEGDPPAAYRYTEARLTRFAEELLRDIEKDTVTFVPNYDDKEVEPEVLPNRVPNLLVNGSSGIAVGMATNIPPHNLGEMVDATLHLIDHPEATSLELMRFVRGPDFPTGAMILGTEGIRQAYLTGRGTITMRARATIEPMGKTDRERIVVTEIPYQVNSARLMEKIAELVKDKKIEGISDIRNESSREGMRIVVELRRDAVGDVVLNNLYKLTPMQENFGYIALAIVGGEPKVLELRTALQVFVEHRREVVTRRSRFELRAAENQREIVLGLGMATTEIDLVIKTIRESSDPETARIALMKLPLRGLEEFVRRAGRPEEEIAIAARTMDFRLSERQAKAILDMRLARLTGLEREKLAGEYGELSVTIARLQAVLATEALLLDVIRGELNEVRAKYSEGRRTEIIPDDGEISIEDLIAKHDVVVTCSHAGYIKRSALADYRSQNRSGRGRIGMEVRDEDWVHQIFVASSHDHLLVLSDRGKGYLKKVYEIPEAGRASRGKAIVNFVGMEPGEKVASVVPVKEFAETLDLVTCTRRGFIKRTQLNAYGNIRQSGIIAVALEDDDALLAALVADPSHDVLVGTRTGMSIRFPLDEVRRVGRDSRGVKAIELREGDAVVQASVVDDPEHQQVLAICANGYGKRSPISEHRVQGRGGIGIIAIDASDRNGDVVDLTLVRDGDQVMVVTNRGQILRTFVDQIRLAGRNTQGVRIIETRDGEAVVAVERVQSVAGEDPAADGDPSASIPPPVEGA